MTIRTLLVSGACALGISPVLSLAQDCGFSPDGSYRDTILFGHPVEDTYFFVSADMSASADGAPNAYHPADVVEEGEPTDCPESGVGLDCLANAGYPHTNAWPQVLVTTTGQSAEAFVRDSGPHSGFFISRTALQGGATPTEPGFYVDASSVPYLVFPDRLHNMDGTGFLGDLGYAINMDTGAASPFIVADIGPAAAPLGEVSLNLAETLTGNDVNPRTGEGLTDQRILYAVFRNSRIAVNGAYWPIDRAQMDEAVDARLEEVGGARHLRACFDHFYR